MKTETQVFFEFEENENEKHDQPKHSTNKSSENQGIIETIYTVMYNNSYINNPKEAIAKTEVEFVRKNGDILRADTHVSIEMATNQTKTEISEDMIGGGAADNLSSSGKQSVLCLHLILGGGC